MIGRLARRILDRRPRRDIYDRAGENVYLRRWHLLGSYEGPIALMVHQMLGPDDDACHHDHPWTFLTLVLRGGYVEHVTRRDREVVRGSGIFKGEVRYEPDVRNGERFVCGGIPRRGPTSIVERRNPPGTIRVNRAEHTHRIDRLPTGECWTLVLRFRKRRSWGFYTLRGWIPWRRFIEERRSKGVAWCAEPMIGYTACYSSDDEGRRCRKPRGHDGECARA